MLRNLYKLGTEGSVWDIISEETVVDVQSDQRP